MVSSTQLVVTSRPEGLSAGPLPGKIIRESNGLCDIAFDNSEIMHGVNRASIQNSTARVRRAPLLKNGGQK
jgi:hypothetical protein